MQQTRKPLFKPSSIDPNFLPKSTDLLRETAFAQVYRSGMDPSHTIYRELVFTRVHLILWGIGYVTLLNDFVESGVDRGIFSPVICRYLDFNWVGK
ncbi:MAG: hypothetical protein WB696_03845 [Chthoniobacterales bacterium]